MTLQQINHDQAKALAKFINAIRNDWDAHGVEAELGRARQLAPAPDLAIAAIKAAGLSYNRTPAVIGMEGPHWRGSVHQPQRKPLTINERCSICSQHADRCRSMWFDDHEFESAADAARNKSARPPEATKAIVQELRGRIEQTRPTPPKRGKPSKPNPKVQAIRDALHPPVDQEGV